MKQNSSISAKEPPQSFVPGLLISFLKKKEEFKSPDKEASKTKQSQFAKEAYLNLKPEEQAEIFSEFYSECSARNKSGELIYPDKKQELDKGIAEHIKKYQGAKVEEIPQPPQDKAASKGWYESLQEGFSSSLVALGTIAVSSGFLGGAAADDPTRGSDYPTVAPTSRPTFFPTYSPSENPTVAPSSAPSFSQAPTVISSIISTIQNTYNATFNSTSNATNPSSFSSPSPSLDPTRGSDYPTVAPTSRPTFFPTYSPSENPTVAPSSAPSFSQAPTVISSIISTIQNTYNATFNSTSNATNPSSFPSPSPSLAAIARGDYDHQSDWDNMVDHFEYWSREHPLALSGVVLGATIVVCATCCLGYMCCKTQDQERVSPAPNDIENQQSIRGRENQQSRRGAANTRTNRIERSNLHDVVHGTCDRTSRPSTAGQLARSGGGGIRVEASKTTVLHSREEDDALRTKKPPKTTSRNGAARLGQGGGAKKGTNDR